MTNEIKDLDHLETLVGSINKMILNAKNKGVLKSKELSLLNLIYKLLKYKCFNSIDNSDRLKLLSLYYKLLNKYNILCKVELNKDYIYYNGHSNVYINTQSNTAPEIPILIPIDPIEIEQPTICDNGRTVTGQGLKTSKLPIILFTKCFIDHNHPASIAKYLKITALPIKGVIHLDGTNIVVDQIIDVTTLDTTSSLDYSTLESNTSDSFTFKLSSLANPEVYSENATINITII